MSDQFTARKLWCLDQILRDKRVTHLAFRLAYYIAHTTNRETGEARFKQETAAEALGVTVRGIQQSAERLRALGYIDISSVRGRGLSNGYRFCLENTNRGSSFPEIKHEQPAPKTRTTRHENTNRHSYQSSLYIPFNIPLGAREASLAEPLASLGASLVARIGAAKAEAWFKGAEVTAVSSDTVTFQLPDKFRAAKVRSHFESDLLACCAALVPTIKAIKFVARKEDAPQGGVRGGDPSVNRLESKNDEAPSIIPSPNILARGNIGYQASIKSSLG
jgi:hypothetical protein